MDVDACRRGELELDALDLSSASGDDDTQSAIRALPSFSDLRCCCAPEPQHAPLLVKRTARRTQEQQWRLHFGA